MILWKEWRETFPLTVLSAVAICLLSLIKWEGWRLEFYEIQYWTIAVLCLPFILLFLGASAIAGERGGKTFDTLVTRPIGLFRIILTKYFAVLANVLVLFAILVVAFYIIRPTHNIEATDLAKGLVILFGFLLFLFSISFCISCVVDRPVKAVIASIVLACMLFFIINRSPFYRYSWWWSDSFEKMWFDYFIFYGILSLLFLAVGCIMFRKRILVDYEWKYMAVVATLFFVVFVKSISTFLWFYIYIAGTGNLDLVSIARQPVHEILETITKDAKEEDARSLKRLLAVSSSSKVERDLIKALSDDNPGIRNLAIKILTDRDMYQLSDENKPIIPPRATASIIPLLEDPDRDVRHSAIGFASDFKCKDAVPALIQQVHDPDSSIRARVMHALGRIEEEDAAPYLMEALRDENPRVSSAAAFQLCLMDYGEARDEIVRIMSESGAKHTRRSFVRYLRHLKSNPACDTLVELLNDDDQWTASSAVVALGNVRCETATDSLLAELDKAMAITKEIQLLMTEKKTAREGEIANANRAGKSSHERKQELVSLAKEASMKVMVVSALKQIGGDEVKQAFRDFLADCPVDHYIKTEVAVALVEMGDDTGVPYLREHLPEKVTEDERGWRARNYATRLAKAGDYSGVPLLISWLDIGYPEQRYRRGENLTELTGKNYGWDSRRWRKWWEKNKDELLQTSPKTMAKTGGD